MIRPLLVVLQVFGRLPIKTRREEALKMKESGLEVVYNVLAWSAHCYYVHRCLKKMLSWEGRTKSLSWTSFVIFLMHDSIAPICYWMDSGLLVDYLSLWSRFEAHHELSMKAGIKYRYTRAALLTATLSVPITTIQLYFAPYWNGLTPLENILTIVPILCPGQMIFLLWIISLAEIKLLARKISSRMINEATSPREATRLRRLWLELGELLRGLAEATGVAVMSYGIGNLMNMLFSFSALANSLWNDENVDQYLYFDFSVSMVFVFFWIFFLEVIHSTVKTVGSDFEEMLLKISLSSRHPAYITEIKLTLLAMELNKPKINFKGLLNGDRGHVKKFLITALTYIIIVMQSLPRRKVATVN